jgi:hypothetical protein
VQFEKDTIVSDTRIIEFHIGKELETPKLIDHLADLVSGNRYGLAFPKSGVGLNSLFIITLKACNFKPSQNIFSAVLIGKILSNPLKGRQESQYKKKT